MYVQTYCLPKKGDMVLVQPDSRPGCNRLGGLGTVINLDYAKMSADMKPIVGDVRSCMKGVPFSEMVRVDMEPPETEVPGGAECQSIAFRAEAESVSGARASATGATAAGAVSLTVEQQMD